MGINGKNLGNLIRLEKLFYHFVCISGNLTMSSKLSRTAIAFDILDNLPFLSC